MQYVMVSHKEVLMKKDESFTIDYSELSLNKEEINKLNELHELTRDDNVEFARIFLNNTWSDIFTDNKISSVSIPYELLNQDSVIYHSHTNSTSFSIKEGYRIARNYKWRIERGYLYEVL